MRSRKPRRPISARNGRPFIDLVEDGRYGKKTAAADTALTAPAHGRILISLGLIDLAPVYVPSGDPTRSATLYR